MNSYSTGGIRCGLFVMLIGFSGCGTPNDGCTITQNALTLIRDFFKENCSESIPVAVLFSFSVDMELVGPNEGDEKEWCMILLKHSIPSGQIANDQLVDMVGHVVFYGRRFAIIIWIESNGFAVGKVGRHYFKNPRLAKKVLELAREREITIKEKWNHCEDILKRLARDG